MRKTSGSLICPGCGRLVSVNEERCPYCGAWRPGMFGYGPALQRFLGGQLDLTNAITGFCVVLYVISLALDPAALLHMGGIFDLLSPSGRVLLHMGMTGRVPLALGQWWTLCTAVFLHGSLLHLLFNMFIMRRYLQMVTDLFGAARSFLIFMAAGIFGFVVSNLVSGNYTIGASGSIFGLLGALISYGRRTGQHTVTNQLWTSAIAMFVMSFFMGANVNNWAHAGGFVGGFVAAELMPTTLRRENMGELLLVGGLALVTLAGFALSLFGVTPAVAG